MKTSLSSQNEKATVSGVEKLNGQKYYPGVAADERTNEEVTERMVRNRLRVENNNPRNND